MKKTLLYILSITIFISCEKEPEDIPEEKSYRIKEMIMDYDIIGENDLLKYSFYYENEKIDKIDYYLNENNTTWEKICTSDFSYNGISISQNYTVYDENFSWWELYQKDYVIDNGLMIELVTGDEDVFEPENKRTYQYSEDRLIGYKGFISANSIDNVWKADYIYENNNQIELKRFYKNTDDIWTQNNKEEFTYEDGKISQLIKHEMLYDGMEPYSKFEYSYTGDKLVKLDYFFWSSDSWVHNGYYSFMYNEDENLIQIDESHGGTRYYEYEIGNGNVDIFTPPHFKLYGLPTCAGLCYGGF